MMHDRIDALLRSTGPAEVIDLGEPGGLENAHLVLESDAGGTVTVEGCATAHGAFASVQEVALDAGAERRERIPLHYPRYIRLAAEGAVLTVRV